ncbi:SDR family oxidoreductase [Rhodococcus sp. ABRD24]|uniref:SDR family NAD(P)-dependent oxidoreductase n=1 Tax=Rhodococcus sp. ABRD24 TaxID=2507582 RepID=UPI00103EBE4F|nr:SDR family oxidoreductase [Rhodococcus sp. ABRD24]QBJ97304.1 SDR family oxidoreductase [Rhodococcus sp. ABRD24]
MTTTSSTSSPSTTALVTGGTGGIGSAVARQLAAEGHDVVLAYRSNTETAATLVAEIEALGVRGAAHRVDLSDSAQLEELVSHVTSTFGDLSILVHAAGPHVPMVHLSRVEPRTYAEHLNAEATAFFTVVRACLPALREASGAVVAVTTAATDRYPVRDGLSAGTKGAVEALVRGFAAEEGRFGVRFNAVGPGMLVDGMAERLISSQSLDQRALDVTMSRIPLQKFGTAVDIAEAVSFLAGPKSGFITGQKLNVDGGYTV